MSKRQIAVIDPGTRVPEIETFNILALESTVPLTYHLPALFGMETLESLPEDLLGIIVLGSGASVYDEDPWIGALQKWWESKLARNIPSLGLCFGHQLIAHMFGAKVGFVSEDEEKLIGTRVVNINKGGFWGEATSGDLVVSHRETVVECPKDFHICASSNAIEFDGIAHQHQPFWGFQPHLEAYHQFMDHQNLPYDGSEKPFELGRFMMKKFIEFCAKNAAGKL